MSKNANFLRLLRRNEAASSESLRGGRQVFFSLAKARDRPLRVPVAAHFKVAFAILAARAGAAVGNSIKPAGSPRKIN